MDIQIKETFRTARDTIRKEPLCDTAESNIQNKERILKAFREHLRAYKGKPIIITDVSRANLKPRKLWNSIF